MSSAPARSTFLVCGAIVLFVFAVYAHVIDCGFVNLDDDAHVRKNPLVVDGLRWTNIKAAFAAPHACLWIPLTWISFMADVSVFGMNAAAMHVVNVVLHAANSVLLFLLLKRATGRFWSSAAVAALFALHPINVESVAWVTERKNVLCLFCGFLSLHAYTTYAQRNSRAAYVAALILFGCALLAKPMLVPLPAGLLLLDAWPLQRIDRATWRRRVLEKVPFLLLALGSALMTMQGSLNAGRSVTIDQLSIGARVSNALISYCTYLRQLGWPSDLCVLYSHKQVAEPVGAAVSSVVLLGFTIAAWRCCRKHPYLIVGWLWFLGMLVPMIGLVQVGPQSHADRFVYAAQIGIFVGVVWWIADVWGERPRRWLAYTAVIVGAALVMTTLRQVEYWTNGATLFEHAIAVTDESPRLYGSAGFARAQLGDYPAAIAHYQNALRINARNAEDWNNLASALIHIDRNADALIAARNAVSLQPDFNEARFNLASAYELTGDDAQAVAEFRKVVQFEPTLVMAQYRLGVLSAKRGEVEAARQALEAAARLRPDDPRIHEALRGLSDNRAQ
jgi:Tfp pilus assembly protein PilF